MAVVYWNDALGVIHQQQRRRGICRTRRDDNEDDDVGQQRVRAPRRKIIISLLHVPDNSTQTTRTHALTPTDGRVHSIRGGVLARARGLPLAPLPPRRQSTPPKILFRFLRASHRGGACAPTLSYCIPSVYIVVSPDATTAGTAITVLFY